MASCVMTEAIVSENRILFKFADGEQLEFGDLEAVDNAIASLSSEQDARLMCIAYAKARSGNLSNINTVKNKTFTVDFTAASPIKVQ